MYGLRFESAYTMVKDDETVIVKDVITFTVEDDEIVGTGETDEEGMTMNLRLSPVEDRLVGTWGEVGADATVVYGGTVSLTVVDQCVLVGGWNMEDSRGYWEMTQEPPAAVQATNELDTIHADQQRRIADALAGYNLLDLRIPAQREIADDVIAEQTLAFTLFEAQS
jgi:hypothetical protein